MRRRQLLPPSVVLDDTLCSTVSLDEIIQRFPVVHMGLRFTFLQLDIPWPTKTKAPCSRSSACI